MQKRHGVQPTQRNFKQTINGPRIKLIIFPSAAKKSIISENNWPIFPLELKESHWSMSFEYYLFYTLLRCSCGKNMQNYLCCFQSPRWTQLLTWEACHWACPEHTGAPEGVWQALSKPSSTVLFSCNKFADFFCTHYFSHTKSTIQICQRNDSSVM